jgi:hypothetical protein
MFPAGLAARLGTIGGVLGTLAGVIELTVGASIRSWVGDKLDTTRLGVVTIALGVAAASCALASGTRRAGSPSRRAALAAGMLAPGLIGFTTTGRLWWVPGGLLVVAGVLAARGLAAHRSAIAGDLGDRLPRLLVGIVGALQVALGWSAHGTAAMLGVAGGVVVIAVAAALPRLPAPVALAAPVLGAIPFAVVTWWSVVTPLLALLAVLLGAAAVTDDRRRATRSRPPDCGRSHGGEGDGRAGDVDAAVEDGALLPVLADRGDEEVPPVAPTEAQAGDEGGVDRDLGVELAVRGEPPDRPRRAECDPHGAGLVDGDPVRHAGG